MFGVAVALGARRTDIKKLVPSVISTCVNWLQANALHNTTVWELRCGCTYYIRETDLDDGFNSFNNSVRWCQLSEVSGLCDRGSEASVGSIESYIDMFDSGEPVEIYPTEEPTTILQLLLEYP